MSRRLRAIRRAVQLAVLALFVYLFLGTVYPLQTALPVNSFLRLDPLVAGTTLLGLRRVLPALIWWALPVTLLTLLLGRAFCGWLCPMGTTIDIGQRIFLGRRLRQSPTRHSRDGDGARFLPLRRVKFYLLIALLFTALMVANNRPTPGGLRNTVGLSAVYLFDPIVTLTRSATLALYAPAQWLVKRPSVAGFLSRRLESDFVTSRPRLYQSLEPVRTVVEGEQFFFRMALLSALLFAVILGLSAIAGRFWCRYLCPLGALLGWLGRRPLVRLTVTDRCTECGRCVGECRLAAISADDPHVHLAAECTDCYTCVDVCPERAIEFRLGFSRGRRVTALDLSRRRVLGAAGAGAAFVLLSRTDWSAKLDQAGRIKVSGSKLIRPPNARPEPEFVTACVRCGECMKICPTNGLQPAVGEAGLEGFWTPILVPRIGPCAAPCNLCGEVCPTDAIRPFTIEEKTKLFIGTAVIDRNRCIAWFADRTCLICDEACSYDAIYQKTVDGRQRPVIDEPKCVGCGLCEKACPVQPQAAIEVFAESPLRRTASVRPAEESTNPYGL